MILIGAWNECARQNIWPSFSFGWPHVLLILLLPPPPPPLPFFLFLFWRYSPRWDLLSSKIVSLKFLKLLNKTYFLWREIFNPTPNLKDGRGVGLITLPPSYADCLEIWEPQPPRTLRVCSGPYWDCFLPFTFNH